MHISGGVVIDLHAKAANLIVARSRCNDKNVEVNVP